MSDRPYLSKSSEELKAIAKGCWGSKAELLRIKSELDGRKWRLASTLSQSIAKRLAELSAADDGTSRSNAERDRASNHHFKLSIKHPTEELSKAKAEIETQRTTIGRLKAELTKNHRSPNADLFAKIHVLESLPSFAIRPLRRAFQKAYHPDQQPPDEKAKAHDAFIAYERIFEQIQRLKGIA